MPPPPLLRGEHAAPTPMKVTEDTPPDLLEGTMDLEVTLPSGSKALVNVHRSTPMMDLLIQVTTAHRINPAGHAINIFSNRGYVTYKPSTPIGTLDTSAIEIVPKSKLKEAAKARKAALHQQALERNIRLKVNLPGNQLGVYRVPPTTLISEVHRIVCQDKAIDAQAFEIRHPVNVDERLRSTCSLSDYQLQEVTLVPKDFRPPPLSVTDLITMASIAHHQEDRKRPPRGIRGFFSRKVKSYNTADSSLSSGSAGDRSLSPARSDESVENKPIRVAHDVTTTPISNNSATLPTSTTLQLSQSRSISTNAIHLSGSAASRPSSVVGMPPRNKKRPAPPPPQNRGIAKQTTIEQTQQMDDEEKENRSSHDNSGHLVSESKDQSSAVSGMDCSRVSPLNQSNLTSTASDSSLSLSSAKGKRKAPPPPPQKVLVKQSHIVIPEEDIEQVQAKLPALASTPPTSPQLEVSDLEDSVAPESGTEVSISPERARKRSGGSSLADSSISETAAVTAALAAMDEATDAHLENPSPSLCQKNNPESPVCDSFNYPDEISSPSDSLRHDSVDIKDTGPPLTKEPSDEHAPLASPDRLSISSASSQQIGDVTDHSNASITIKSVEVQNKSGYLEKLSVNDDSNSCDGAVSHSDVRRLSVEGPQSEYLAASSPELPDVELGSPLPPPSPLSHSTLPPTPPPQLHPTRKLSQSSLDSLPNDAPLTTTATHQTAAAATTHGMINTKESLVQESDCNLSIGSSVRLTDEEMPPGSKPELDSDTSTPAYTRAASLLSDSVCFYSIPNTPTTEPKNYDMDLTEASSPLGHQLEDRNADVSSDITSSSAIVPQNSHAKNEQPSNTELQTEEECHTDEVGATEPNSSPKDKNKPKRKSKRKWLLRKISSISHIGKRKNKKATPSSFDESATSHEVMENRDAFNYAVPPPVSPAGGASTPQDFEDNFSPRPHEEEITEATFQSVHPEITKFDSNLLSSDVDEFHSIIDEELDTKFKVEAASGLADNGEEELSLLSESDADHISSNSNSCISISTLNSPNPPEDSTSMDTLIYNKEEVGGAGSIQKETESRKPSLKSWETKESLSENTTKNDSFGTDQKDQNSLIQTNDSQMESTDLYNPCFNPDKEAKEICVSKLTIEIAEGGATSGEAKKEDHSEFSDKEDTPPIAAEKTLENEVVHSMNEDKHVSNMQVNHDSQNTPSKLVTSKEESEGSTCDTLLDSRSDGTEVIHNVLESTIESRMPELIQNTLESSAPNLVEAVVSSVVEPPCKESSDSMNPLPTANSVPQTPSSTSTFGQVSSDSGLQKTSNGSSVTQSEARSDELERRTGSLSSAASGSSIEKTAEEDFPYQCNQNGGPESAYDSMSDVPREGSSKSDYNSPFISPDSTLSKDSASSSCGNNLKEIEEDCGQTEEIHNDITQTVNTHVLENIEGENVLTKRKVILEYSNQGEASTDDPPVMVSSCDIQIDSMKELRPDTPKSLSSPADGDLSAVNGGSTEKEINDFVTKQNVINELKSVQNSEPKIVGLKPKQKDWFDSKQSNYTVILSMEPNPAVKRSPSDESLSSYSSADDIPKLRNKSISSIKTSRSNTVSSYESAPPPIPDTCIPESDLEDDVQSLSSSVSISSNSLDRRRTPSLSRESSVSDLGWKTREEPAIRPRQPLFSIATYKNRAEEISYDKRLHRSESFHGVKKTRSVACLNEIHSDSKNFHPYRFGRNDSLRDINFAHDSPYLLKGNSSSSAVPKPSSQTHFEPPSTPTQTTPPPNAASSSFSSKSGGNIDGCFKEGVEEPEIQEHPFTRPYNSSSRPTRPSSTALDFKIGVYETRPVAPARKQKQDPHQFIQPAAHSTTNLKRSPMKKSQSTIDIRGSGDGQFLPGGFQNAGDSGLAQEYLKLQDDFMKWQRQLLQNQHVLHSRVAPIAAQPPTMNNIGAYKDMLNHSSQQQQQPMSNLPNQIPQQQQQAPKKPIEINIPIRFEDDDVPDSTPSFNQPITNPQQRWNNSGSNAPTNLWQNSSGGIDPQPNEKRDFVVVANPPQIFEAPTDPRLIPVFKNQQPLSQQQQFKERSPLPQQQWGAQPPSHLQQPPQANHTTGGFPEQYQQEPNFTPNQHRSPPFQNSAPQIAAPVQSPGGQFVDSPAARKAFWGDTQTQRTSPKTILSDTPATQTTAPAPQRQWGGPQNQRPSPPKASPDTLMTQVPSPTQRQSSPFRTDHRQQMPNRSPEVSTVPSAPQADDNNVNARFTSVVTLNDRTNQDANSKDKVRSIVQLNNVDNEPRPSFPNAPVVRGFKLPQENQSRHEQPDQPPVMSPSVQNAKARPWSNRSGSAERSSPSYQQNATPTNVPSESATPMSSRLVQALQQPNAAPPPSSAPSPPKRAQKSPSPVKTEQPSLPPQLANISLKPAEPRFSPPKFAPTVSSIPAAVRRQQQEEEDPCGAGPPAPPAPPPPPPPPMKMPSERRTSTGKKIISCQQKDQPELDARAELMMAIRQFGGSNNLRRKNAGMSTLPPVEYED